MNKIKKKPISSEEAEKRREALEKASDLDFLTLSMI